MVRQRLNKITLYRYRYAIAYMAFALALATMLIVSGFYLPGGLTDTEMRSAIVSDNLNPALLFNLQPEQLIYLPYRLLQAATISLFGISLIGIKLPSILLGFISALGVLYLLNLWYHRNVAIVTALVVVTTNQFLIAAQSGQAGVLYIFLTTMILIAASMIARRSIYAKAWIILGFVLAGISLYMPLNIYILIALVMTAMIHPHARHLFVRQSPKGTVAVGALLFLLIISPLVFGCIKDIGTLWTLLGVSDGIHNFRANAEMLLRNYGSFSAPVSGATITPVYGLGLALMILLGLYRLVSAKYTARSYIISFWLVMLIPLVCLNPAFVSIAFVPVVLLIALAVDYLIFSWYRLFPHNPYARVFGLMPLAVLMAGLVISSIDRYVYGLHYDDNVYKTYSYDLPVLDKRLSQLDDSESVTLIVPSSESEFYRSYAKHQNHIKELVVTSDTGVIPQGTSIVERSLKGSIPAVASEILVTRTSTDADRFYLYKKS